MILLMWLLPGLPNLHPALVHFPLAIFPAAVVFDLAALFLRRVAWLDRAATALYVLGAMGAGAAYLAGEEAEEGLHGLPAAVGVLIDQHSVWAARALWTIVALALLRLGLAWHERRRAVSGYRPLRYAVLVVAAAALWLLVETADRGGALVYRHGVAVQPAGAAEPPAIP